MPFICSHTARTYPLHFKPISNYIHDILTSVYHRNLQLNISKAKLNFSSYLKIRSSSVLPILENGTINPHRCSVRNLEAFFNLILSLNPYTYSRSKHYYKLGCVCFSPSHPPCKPPLSFTWITSIFSLFLSFSLLVFLEYLHQRSQSKLLKIQSQGCLAGSVG